MKKLLLLATLLALPLASCSGQELPDVTPSEDKSLVSEVHFDQTYLPLDVGDTAQLTYTVSFKDEAEHEDYPVKWISSDINVCTVDKTGFVTAISGGEAAVSLIAGYKMATCRVKVSTGSEQPATGDIIMSPTELTMAVGEQFQLTATPPTQVTLKWVSGDETIASVDQTGLVTAIGVGQVDIGVSALGKSASCHVTVLDAGDVFIRLSDAKVELAAGETYQLTAVTQEECEVSWSSSDEELATVDQTGLVSAQLDVEGSVTITATANEHTAICVFDIVNEDDIYDVTISFFVDYNNIDTTDTTGTKLLAKFRWFNDKPLSESGKVPANPTVAMDPAFPYFIGWSSHTIIDSKADLWNMESDVTGNTPYLYLYGIWADVPAGEFTK